MRINTGKYKGRLIKMPSGIRPTQDKVRKALFDILGGVEGLNFLELFAGSASVGIEALSRGVSNLVVVEASPACRQAIKNNMAALGIIDYELCPMEADKAVGKFCSAGKKFDIIFLDPPYYREMAKKTLQMLGAYDILAPNGFVISQHFKKDLLPEIAGSLTRFREAVYGDTVLSFYRKEG
ncbi:MAG: 16S rRNA (guanine(966)-N(2))-methyltransferase RsmD [Candidatus Omnitrophota bacterium]